MSYEKNVSIFPLESYLYTPGVAMNIDAKHLETICEQ